MGASHGFHTVTVCVTDYNTVGHNLYRSWDSSANQSVTGNLPKESSCRRTPNVSTIRPRSTAVAAESNWSSVITASARSATPGTTALLRDLQAPHDRSGDAEWLDCSMQRARRTPFLID